MRAVGGAHSLITFYVARVARQIFCRPELRGVYKDAHRHAVVFTRRRAYEACVPFVQIAHRGNEPYCKPLRAPLLDLAAYFVYLLKKLHQYLPAFDISSTWERTSSGILKECSSVGKEPAFTSSI
ncbi:hypothetical protein SDC9_154743 [bioreactor metagenome]|uniref:Uncharacterized protein n=1 Tax=bioreactor metagenome TaxID=1076179 RepID=A0A645F4H9_9ZZZZ